MTLGWRWLWPDVRTWWGGTAAIIAGFLLVYGGGGAVRQIYNWSIYELQDRKIREFLESSVTRSTPVNGVEQLSFQLKSVSEIASATRMSEKRVVGSLKRLKKEGIVEQVGNHWRAMRGS